MAGCCTVRTDPLEPNRRIVRHSGMVERIAIFGAIASVLGSLIVAHQISNLLFPELGFACCTKPAFPTIA